MTLTDLARPEPPRVHLSADIGGTFTDVVAWIPATRSMILAKAPTTPEDLSQGVLDGIALVAKRLDADAATLLAATERFVHGTTVATNTLAEGTGPRLGMITTRGFRDVLELRDGTKQERYALRTAYPAALIPRDLRLAVPERLRWDGGVDVALDEAAVAAACRRLMAEGVEGIVVAMLHSHVDPVHELRAEAIVRDCGWTGEVVLSHRIHNRQGEYARFSTAAVSAYVAPRLRAYLGRLRDRLSASRPDLPISIVQSSGGRVPVEVATDHAVGCVTSGPAGGAIACALLAERSGIENAVAFDIGGTTTDISLIEDRRCVERETTKNDAWIVAVPSIDVRVHAIGGGSIATVDAGGILCVGPRSAGANPGPAAYGRGGLRATVTDAAVVLGCFDAGGLGESRLSLDRECAAQALRLDVATPLRLSVEDAALAVYRLAAAKVADGVRSAVIGRGTDPREIDLIAFGGAGGLYVDSVMSELGMPRAIAPRAASVFSAFGFLAGCVRFDEGTTVGRATDRLTPAELGRILAGLRNRVASRLAAAGFTTHTMRFEVTLDCRYDKQTGAIGVRPSLDADGNPDLARVVEDFERRYEALYAHRHPGQACIVEACRVTGTGDEENVSLPPASGRATPREALRGFRNVYSETGWTKTPVYDFEAMHPGASVDGPALLDSPTTTIMIGHGSRAEIDPLGSVVVTRPSTEAPA